MAQTTGWQPLMTLGRGRKSRAFLWKKDARGISVITGNWGSKERMTRYEVAQCLDHFQGCGWFPLDVSMTRARPGGLGHYLRSTCGISPRFASHFAAVLCHEGKLVSRYFGNSVLLLVC
jgi:hypothetical protein